MQTILVVDDERNMCEVLKILLENEGYRVFTSGNGQEAVKIIETENFNLDLIITDLKMPSMDGLELLNYLKENQIKIPCIVISAYGSIETAVDAMKKGAIDFITKPFNKNIIKHTINKIFLYQDIQQENQMLKNTITEKGIIYRSAVMKNIMETVKKVALAPTPVLIIGESGTGKELIARAIHSFCQSEEEGKQGFKPFYGVNCPAIPESLFESELFGYRRGAFSGANEDFSGKIKLADRGILFLDEIGDIPLAIQPKLLRFLEEKEYQPLGSTKTVTVDTRIICATNQNLKELVDQNLFRSDLYYRINTITISIPALRERKEDILPIAYFFLKKYAEKLKREKLSLATETEDILVNYIWPGNVRELRNIIERAVVLCGKDMIFPSDLPCELEHKQEREDTDQNQLARNEKKILSEALKRSQGNISAAAKELGITRNTIRYRIKKYHLEE